MIRSKRTQGGFTLVFTIFLIAILTTLGVAIITKVWIGTRQSLLNKERQNATDAATIGLNMAMDEISPGIERMRNVVWNSTVGAPGSQTTALLTQAMILSGTTNPSSQPVRQLSLIGNIRNWDAFADWTRAPGSLGWNKGWTYMQHPSSGTANEYFDPGTNRSPVMVGTTNTTNVYWYGQLQPQPPTLADGAMNVPTTWQNHRVGILDEYPDGMFDQPILKKVYTVRNNPMTRVAVYVRMSLQDYCGAPATNINFAGARNNTAGTINFQDSNAVAFSVFAVSEPTPTARPVRVHQALNVAIGGIEYIAGTGLDAPGTYQITVNGVAPPPPTTGRTPNLTFHPLSTVHGVTMCWWLAHKSPDRYILPLVT